ncbi:MAG: hypothetical protein HN368_21845 [Spirochaetales bacterium]|jgi:hypothetical protein|nr:hypothetical protein [Spirochaetales bacterium]
MSKTVTKIILLLFSSTLIFSIDPSTPDDGNLYREISGSFLPNNIVIYDNDSILNESGIVIENDRLFRSDKKDIDYAIKNRALGSDISWINDETFVVLTGNSDRYSHGILGDNVEATGFEVYDNSSQISNFEVPSNRVFETLRPLIADVIPENPGVEIILTSSNHLEGSRIEIYSQEGEFLGNSDSIGRGFRWLHVIAAAPFSSNSKQYIAIVRTPHINGILELYFWNGNHLVKEASTGNVSTHQIGSDNLNMALVSNFDSTPGPEFLIPSFDFRSLVIIKYTFGELSEVKRFDLPGRIATNIFFDNIQSNSIWVGLANGKIVRLTE